MSTTTGKQHGDRSGGGPHGSSNATRPGGGKFDVENLRRAGFASTAGSALEYYDFALYSLSASVIFSKLFFPGLGELGGQAAAIATFGVGFFARPLGGLFFGLLGDRMGRKTVLLVTILLMGGSSTLIGLLPTADVIGWWAPVLLVTLRLLQGFGAGAEQAGATVLMAEASPARNRGFVSSIPFIGIQAGTVLAAAVFALTTLAPDDVLYGWLWRIPFLASFLLVLVAVYIRLKLRESPTFVSLEKRDQERFRDSKHIGRGFWANILRGIGLRMAENGGSYLYNTIAISYAVNVMHQDKTLGSWAVAVGSLVGMVTLPWAGWLSDRIGRKRIYLVGAIALLVWAFPSFWLLSLGQPVLVFVVLVVGIALGVNIMLGSQCAYLPELFGNKHRYFGVAISREVSAVIAGGLATIIAPIFISSFAVDSWWMIALYVAILCVITIVSAIFSPETAGRDLESLSDASIHDPATLRGVLEAPTADATLNDRNHA